MAHLALVLLGGGAAGPNAECLAPGTTGTITAPTNAMGCTVELWGGGGGGSSNPGLAGYGGGGAAFVRRSFAVVGGTTQIGYTVGGFGQGGGPYSNGVDGGDSIINIPPTTPTIALTAGGGKGGQTTAPGAAGTITVAGGIPEDNGSAPTAGTVNFGGNAGNQPAGGVNGSPGVTPGGGGDDSGVTGGFGFRGGNGSICFYWIYPSNVVLADEQALNFSLTGVGGTATATYQLANTGVASATNTAGVLTAITGQWLTSGTAADYEVFVEWSTTGGGTTGGAAAGSWLGLGTTRSFTLTATNDSVQRDLYVRIRNAATQKLLAFCTITVWVDSAP